MTLKGGMMVEDEGILVSVEMITYNQERYIAKALDSVLMQEVDFKYEIVIGEDCSTDSTRQVLLKYQALHPDKIRLVLHKENVGMRNNAKAVSDVSKGSFIALLEGDDYWIDQQKLQIQIDEMQEHPECYLSFHAAQKRIGEDEHGEVIARRAEGNRVFSTSETILGGGGFCPTASIVYRRELRSSLPDFYYEFPAGDYFMQILGSLNGGLLYIDRVMSVYRQAVEGSWNSAMEDVNKRERFVEAALTGMDKLNTLLDRRYDDEIRQSNAKLYYDTASFYLHCGMYDKFRLYMEKSAETYRLDTTEFRIDYALRGQPRMLMFMRKLKSRLGSIKV